MIIGVNEITFLDRDTGEQREEEVYGRRYIEFLYGGGVIAGLANSFLSRSPVISGLFGWLQKQPRSKKKIIDFIKKFEVDPSEFADPVQSYRTFNDFFIRKLKEKSRPIVPGSDVATLPADGRYLAWNRFDEVCGIHVKGRVFSLSKLLGSEELAHKYVHGALAIVRLAPVDYHRFHFPIACTPLEPRLINGPLFSVNPIALRKNIEILAENKRMITTLDSKTFGKVLFIEVGATNVGSIHQTFFSGKPVQKGDEKGYFSFGGSCIILLFPPNVITFAEDLTDATENGFETLAKYGQILGILR